MKNLCFGLCSMYLILVLGVVIAGGSEHTEYNGFATQSAINDVSIVAKITSKITEEPLLQGSNVEVVSDYGNVTVSGLVDTNLQAEKIITLAQSVKWVKDVDARNLKVKNSKVPLTDTYITAKVYGALIRDNFLEPMKLSALQVETKDRVVSLAGKVKNSAEVDGILKSVKSVQGIKSIKNGIVVK